MGGHSTKIQIFHLKYVWMNEVTNKNVNDSINQRLKKMFLCLNVFFGTGSKNNFGRLGIVLLKSPLAKM